MLLIGLPAGSPERAPIDEALATWQANRNAAIMAAQSHTAMLDSERRLAIAIRFSTAGVRVTTTHLPEQSV